MKTYIFILSLLAFFISCKNSEDWKLVWSDEFEADGHPDQSSWSYEKGYVRNNELQYYTEKRLDNARVEDGMLIIESRKDNFENNAFTSASIHTSGKQDFLYGKIEVRAKIPTGKGMWPAIWLLGNNIKQVGWPACGELDIMENVGFDPDKIHANIHCEAYNHTKGNGKGNNIVINKPFEDFHTYAMESTENKIDFFVDDSLYFTYGNEGKGAASWPFDKPHYLILNSAIGGAWGGQQGVDDSIFPQKYYIDYVRYYKKD